MSILSKLFGSKEESPKEKPKAQGQGGLAQRLERLEKEAENAAPGYVGTTYNRAGDVALKEGDPDRAMSFYGRAIDAFLEDEQPEAARGVANKILRLRPHAARTLCTLMWLDLAAKHTATALLHLRDYVGSAKRAKQSKLAASQIYDMARIVSEPEVLGAIADALDSLDVADRAATVREWENAGGSPTAIKDADELASLCMKAAARSNEIAKKEGAKK
jgi:tetratricopeptide (TPR) repeat protein